ncbi:hypothetical protein GCM10027159_10980 [Lysobacter terrae]
MLGVSRRTIGHWETGRARPSFAAFKLLRVLRHGDLIDPAWSGYALIRGRLVTPEGHSFAPWDMSWLSLLVRRAEAFGHLLREREAGKPENAREARSGVRPVAAASVAVAASVAEREVLPLGSQASFHSWNIKPPNVTVHRQYPPLPVGDDYSLVLARHAHLWNSAPCSNTGMIRGGVA